MDRKNRPANKWRLAVWYFMLTKLDGNEVDSLSRLWSCDYSHYSVPNSRTLKIEKRGVILNIAAGGEGLEVDGALILSHLCYLGKHGERFAFVCSGIDFCPESQAGSIIAFRSEDALCFHYFLNLNSRHGVHIIDVLLRLMEKNSINRLTFNDYDVNKIIFQPLWHRLQFIHVCMVGLIVHSLINLKKPPGICEKFLCKIELYNPGSFR